MTLKKILESESYVSYRAMTFGPSDIGRNRPRTVHYNSGRNKEKLQGETESFVKPKKKKKKKILEMTTSAAVGSNLIPTSFLGRIMRRFKKGQERDDILGLLHMVKGTKK